MNRLVAAVRARIPQAFSRDQLVVRLAGAVVLVAALGVAGSDPRLLALLVVAALVAVVLPDPAGAALTLAAAAACWLLGARPVGSWHTLLVALALLVDHTCLVLATTAPPLAPLPRPVVERAVRRAGVVALVTVVAWVLLALAPPVSTVPVAAVVGSLAVLGAAAWWFSGSRRPGPGQRR